MNTKTILGLGTSVLLVGSLLTTSLYANPACKNESSCKKESSCKHDKKMKHNKKGDKQKGNIVRMFMKLDLSDKQREEVLALIKQSRQSIPNPSTAFSDTNFDKDKFIKLVNQKREAKLKNRAELIEKIYKVLTPAQKKDLKTMLDMKDIKKKDRAHSKSCKK